MPSSNTDRQNELLYMFNRVLAELREEWEDGAPVVETVVTHRDALFDIDGNWFPVINQPKWSENEKIQAAARLERHASDTVNEYFTQRNEKYGYTLITPEQYPLDDDFVPVDLMQRDVMENKRWPARYEQDDIILTYSSIYDWVITTDGLAHSSGNYSCNTSMSNAQVFAENTLWPDRISMDDVNYIHSCNEHTWTVASIGKDRIRCYSNRI